MSFLVERNEADYDIAGFSGGALRAGFDLSTASAMAWMAQLAYETSDERKIERIARRWSIDAIDVVHQPARSTLPLSNTHGVVARIAGCTIVAFAGTDPADLVNWITDFYLGHLRADMHEGFRDAAAAIWNQVGEVIRRNMSTGEPLFVTGHSLGAAIALATLDRARDEHGLRHAEVYVFGCPRVGRDAFRRRYNDCFGNSTYRLVHGHDIVATVPPTEFGFRHVGRFLSCCRGARFNAAHLEHDTSSDQPLAEAGVFGGMALRLRSLVDRAHSPASRLDLVGRLSELLSPAIGDHLPDRYIAALEQNAF